MNIAGVDPGLKGGIVITNTDGDEPGVAMNLVRFVNGVGYRAVAAGNLKGMIDPYRTPETQKAFAEKYHQKPRMITSFARPTMKRCPSLSIRPRSPERNQPSSVNAAAVACGFR